MKYSNSLIMRRNQSSSSVGVTQREVTAGKRPGRNLHESLPFEISSWKLDGRNCKQACSRPKDKYLRVKAQGIPSQPQNPNPTYLDPTKPSKQIAIVR